MGGDGTDTALETADIALMSDDVSELPYTIKISWESLGITERNITFLLGIRVTCLGTYCSWMVDIMF